MKEGYKSVKIDLTIRTDVEVPADWDDDLILFHYNDGCYCLDNLVEDLAAKIAAEPNTCHTCFDGAKVTLVHE